MVRDSESFANKLKKKGHFHMDKLSLLMTTSMEIRKKK